MSTQFWTIYFVFFILAKAIPTASVKVIWNYKADIAIEHVIDYLGKPIFMLEEASVKYVKEKPIILRHGKVPDFPEWIILESIRREIQPDHSTIYIHECIVLQPEVPYKNKFRLQFVGKPFLPSVVLLQKFLGHMNANPKMSGMISLNLVNTFNTDIRDKILNLVKRDSRWIGFDVTGLYLLEEHRFEKKHATVDTYSYRLIQQPVESELNLSFNQPFIPYLGVIIYNCTKPAQLEEIVLVAEESPADTDFVSFNYDLEFSSRPNEWDEAKEVDNYALLSVQATIKCLTKSLAYFVNKLDILDYGEKFDGIRRIRYFICQRDGERNNSFYLATYTNPLYPNSEILNIGKFSTPPEAIHAAYTYEFMVWTSVIPSRPIHQLLHQSTIFEKLHQFQVYKPLLLTFQADTPFPRLVCPTLKNLLYDMRELKNGTFQHTYVYELQDESLKGKLYFIASEIENGQPAVANLGEIVCGHFSLNLTSVKTMRLDELFQSKGVGYDWESEKIQGTIEWVKYDALNQCPDSMAKTFLKKLTIEEIGFKQRVLVEFKSLHLIPTDDFFLTPIRIGGIGTTTEHILFQSDSKNKARTYNKIISLRITCENEDGYINPYLFSSTNGAIDWVNSNYGSTPFIIKLL